MKRIASFLVVFVLVFGCVLWTGTETSWARGGEDNSIYPDSIFYPLDRLGESLKSIFLSDEDQVSFYLELSLERFDEARYMFIEDDSDRAFELFKEGLSNIGHALEIWKDLLAEDVEMENLKDDLKDVIEDAKETFKQLKDDLNLRRIGELSKELGELVKEQVNIFLNMDKN